MRFSLRCLPVLSIGLLLVGCQGDTRAPVAPDRALDGAAAIKCPWDKSVTDVYQNKFRSDKTAACKDAAEFVDGVDLTTAELVINELLLALYNDYAVCVGAPFGTQDLSACPFADGASVDPAAVVAFAQATCDIAPGLPQTGDVDCVVPSVENLSTNPAPPTDPTDGTDAGWIVAGPVGEGAIVELSSDEFGIQIDDLEAGIAAAYVSIRENPPTVAVGICPVNSDNDCTQNNYTVDMDGIGEPYIDNDPIADIPDPGLYVEICEGPAPFAPVSVPARCLSSSNTCEPGQSVPDRDLLACSKGALAFAPSTWTATDGALAVRDVICKVDSQSAAVSEGTTCTVVDRVTGIPVPGKSCLTVATPAVSPKAAECTIPDILAANLDDAHDGSPVLYRMEASKIESGVSHFGSTDFELSQTDPTFGNTKDVFVDVLPPGQQ